jgi:hypothetical protein
MHALCFDCVRDGEPGLTEFFFEGDVLDDGTIVGTCKAGHDNAVGRYLPKFEFLFECAGRALLDGHYRECVLGIATAIERFFEFYVRVACRKRGLQAAALEDAWGPLDSSERQRGGFTFVHLLHSGKAADLGALEKWRNKLLKPATQDGYQPTRNETLAYAAWALKQLHHWMAELHSVCPSEFALEAARGTAQTKEPPAVTSMFISKTLLSAAHPDIWGKETFDEAVERMRIGLQGHAPRKRSAPEAQ